MDFNEWFIPHRGKFKEICNERGWSYTNARSKFKQLHERQAHWGPDNASIDKFVEIYAQIKENGFGTTEKSMFLNYGAEEGARRWREYCDRQAFTNSLEYKKSKYGMTEEDFDNYNASRAITKRNLITKYGETEGLVRWESYRKRQSYTKSFEYQVELHGDNAEEEWSRICSSKALTLDNFIKRYGDDGKAKYLETWSKIRQPSSKAEQAFIGRVESLLTEEEALHSYKQYHIMGSNGSKFYDFVNTKLGICVEYNGNFWHANPRLYGKDDYLYAGKNASDVWEDDIHKLSNAIKHPKISKVFIVWEGEEERMILEIQRAIEEIRNESRINHNG